MDHPGRSRGQRVRRRPDKRLVQSAGSQPGRRGRRADRRRGYTARRAPVAGRDGPAGAPDQPARPGRLARPGRQGPMAWTQGPAGPGAMLIDTDVPGDGSLVTVINVGGVEITAFCHPVQLMLSFNATVGMTPRGGRHRHAGDAPSNIDFQGIQGFPITKAIARPCTTRESWRTRPSACPSSSVAQVHRVPVEGPSE